METIEGRRALVYDAIQFKNDTVTPFDKLFLPATITKNYGKTKWSSGDLVLGPYEDLVDVVFDHRPGVQSRGHFTGHIELIGE